MSAQVVEALELRELTTQSCALKVRAQPGAKRSGLIGSWNGMLKIAVRAPAEDGRANAELIEVLAETLALKRQALSMLSGEKSRLKEIAVPLPAQEARRRLNEHLSSE